MTTTATAPARRATANELMDTPDDGFLYELARGELRKMSPAGQFHGECAASCAGPLIARVKANGLGKVYIAETGFILATDPDHVLVPDFAFVSAARLDALGESPGFVSGAPDVAFEVVSPSDRYSRVEEKAADYLDAGALAVVVIDPRRRDVSVHRPRAVVEILTESDTLELPDAIPGWRMRVRDIFEW